mgnify:CR=1 FL=1
MKSRTYYEILGVSRDASIEEITIAKNALAKVYHPDANAHKDIDTTAFMQEILEAYQTLSDPEKEKVMMHSFSGIQNQWNGYLRHSSLSRRKRQRSLFLLLPTGMHIAV